MRVLTRSLAMNPRQVSNKDFSQLVRLTPAAGPPPSPCQKVLKPVLLSLGLVGVYVHKKKPLPHKGHPHRLWCALVFAYLLANVALSLSQVVLKNGRPNLLDTVANLLGSTTACLISAAVALNARSLLLLHTEVNDLLPPIGGMVRNLPLLLTLLAWAFILMRWLSLMNILDDSFAYDQFLTLFQSLPPPHFSGLLTTLTVAVQWSAQNFFVTGTLVFVPVYFMSLCLLLARAFRHHNDLIADCYAPSSAELARTRRLHERLCGAVAATDRVFGLPVFVWCLLIILSACLDLTQLFTDDNLLRDLDRSQLFHFTLRGVYSALTFVGTCLTAARVSEEAHAALPAVHALTLRHARLTLDAKMEAQLLVCRLTSPHIGLTAWHFFRLDRSFILNITAAVTTYMVIVIQLNPKTVKAINKLVTEALNTTAPVSNNVTIDG